jgi:hypothetical protein
MVVPILGSLGFVAVGIFLLLTGTKKADGIIGIITLAVFGFFFVAGIYTILRNPSRLVISETGLTVRSARIGEVAWEDIRSIQMGTVDRKQIITVSLSSKEKYLKRRAEKLNPLYELDGSLELGELVIDPQTFESRPDELYEVLKTHLSLQHRSSNRSSRDSISGRQNIDEH